MTKEKKGKLETIDLKVGKGKAVETGNTITVHYAGYFTTGKKFDSSHDRNEPFEVTIGVGYVIKGWDLGIIGMKTGGKRKLTIPYDLGYGKYGAGEIPGFTTLIFEIELLKIK